MRRVALLSVFLSVAVAPLSIDHDMCKDPFSSKCRLIKSVWKRTLSPDIGWSDLVALDDVITDLEVDLAFDQTDLRAQSSVAYIAHVLGTECTTDTSLLQPNYATLRSAMIKRLYMLQEPSQYPASMTDLVSDVRQRRLNSVESMDELDHYMADLEDDLAELPPDTPISQLQRATLLTDLEYLQDRILTGLPTTSHKRLVEDVRKRELVVANIADLDDYIVELEQQIAGEKAIDSYEGDLQADMEYITHRLDNTNEDCNMPGKCADMFKPQQIELPGLEVPGKPLVEETNPAVDADDQVPSVPDITVEIVRKPGELLRIVYDRISMLIKTVKDGPAMRAGVQPGCHIKVLAGRYISNVDDYKAALGSAGTRFPLTLSACPKRAHLPVSAEPTGDVYITRQQGTSNQTAEPKVGDTPAGSLAPDHAFELVLGGPGGQLLPANPALHSSTS